MVRVHCGFCLRSQLQICTVLLDADSLLGFNGVSNMPGQHVATFHVRTLLLKFIPFSHHFLVGQAGAVWSHLLCPVPS